MLDSDINLKIKNIEEQAYALGFDGFGITSPEIDEVGNKLLVHATKLQSLSPAVLESLQGLVGLLLAGACWSQS